MSTLSTPVPTVDIMVCECGHSYLKHSFIKKWSGAGRCTHQDIVDESPRIHVYPCGCKKFKPMDWITDFCIIPERMVDK